MTYDRLCAGSVDLRVDGELVLHIQFVNAHQQDGFTVLCQLYR